MIKTHVKQSASMSSRRLRGAQPPAGALEHTSSSSSLSSNKQDKASKENTRRDSPSDKPRDPSSSSDDNAKNPPPPERGTRQTRQQQKREVSGLDGANDNTANDDDEDADGEITRCICGQAEYPGPPVPLTENGRNGGPRESGRLASLAAAEGLPEDAGGLFIQCDECHVWQHGGCVGIMQEDHSPDNYYCERCRKDLHRLMIGARGYEETRDGPSRDYETDIEVDNDTQDICR